MIKKKNLWMLAAVLIICGAVLTACSDDDHTLYNSYIKTLDDGTLLIEPATGEPYCNRSWDFPYKITHDDLCFRLFTEAGFEWGGDWTTRKDYQHFEIIE